MVSAARLPQLLLSAIVPSLHGQAHEALHVALCRPPSFAVVVVDADLDCLPVSCHVCKEYRSNSSHAYCKQGAGQGQACVEKLYMCTPSPCVQHVC